MIRKYRVKRTVIITTTDVVCYDGSAKELENHLDSNMMSVAGEIGHLGLDKYHGSVSYSFGDTIVNEVN
jgi:predicted alpha/beta hydrolase family esterase